jgi:capsular polysaccharide transport system permease protein
MRVRRVVAALLNIWDAPLGVGGPGVAAPALNGRVSLPRLGLLDHMFIIRAMALRYLKLRHRETRLGYLMEFTIPVIIIIFHTWLFTVVNRWMPGGIPQPLYVIGGFAAWFTFAIVGKRKIPFRWERSGGLNFPALHVTPMHYFAAICTWNWLKMNLICFVGVMVAAVFYRGIPIPDVVAILVALSVAAALGFGYGQFFGVLGRRWWVVDDFRRMLLLLMFMTSGLYGTDPSRISILNEWYNPMYHVIQIMRHSLYPSYPLWHADLLYTIAWAFGLVFMGLLLNRLAEELGEEWVSE